LLLQQLQEQAVQQLAVMAMETQREGMWRGI
jgi:hypothetical protein